MPAVAVSDKSPFDAPPYEVSIHVLKVNTDAMRILLGRVDDDDSVQIIAEITNKLAILIGKYQRGEPLLRPDQQFTMEQLARQCDALEHFTVANTGAF